MRSLSEARQLFRRYAAFRWAGIVGAAVLCCACSSTRLPAPADAGLAAPAVGVALSTGQPGGATRRIALADDDVGLYVSPTTNRYYAALNADYGLLVNPWRRYFGRRQMTPAPLDTEAALAAFHGRVLVVPDAVALDRRERALLTAFVQHGGSVLADWAVGVRDGDGAWIGYDFADALMQIHIDREIDRNGTRFLATFGDSPVAHSLPAGQKAWLGQGPEAPLAATGTALAARFVDAVYQNPSGAVNGAVLYDESAGARRVYFGFSSLSWRFDPATIDALLDDSLNWLARNSTPLIAAWPAGNQAAQMIAMDAQDGFENAERLSDLVRAAGATASFFCLTSVALHYPDITRELARGNDVGYLADTYAGLQGESYATQAGRVRNAVAQLRSVLPGSGVRAGFRAPSEGSDATTERVLGEFGLSYLVTGPAASTARMPFLSSNAAAAATLVVLPRTQLDDANLLKVPAGNLYDAMLADSRAVWEMGGLGILSIESSHLAGDAPLTPVLPAYLDQVIAAKGRVWLASGSEIAAWWRRRSRVTIGLESHTLTIVVQNTPIDGLTLLIPNPQAGSAIRLNGPNAPAPRAVNAFQTAYVFARLEPGVHQFGWAGLAGEGAPADGTVPAEGAGGAAPLAR